MRIGVPVAAAVLIASSVLAAPPPPPTGGGAFRFTPPPPPNPTLPRAPGPQPGQHPIAPQGAQGLSVRATASLDTVVAHYSAAYETCVRKAVATPDMIDCAAKETERWDGRLNRAYQARMNSLNDRQRAALKRAEKTWLAFRQADCEAYEDEEWGTISRIDASQCYLRRTVERALELESFPTDHGPG